MQLLQKNLNDDVVERLMSLNVATAEKKSERCCCGKVVEMLMGPLTINNDKFQIHVCWLTNDVLIINNDQWIPFEKC